MLLRHASVKIIGASLLSAAAVAGTPQSALAQVETAGVGVHASMALGAKPWSIVSLRVSLPAGEKLALDLDTGHVFGAGDLTQGFIPRGFAFAAHLRWKPKGRSSRGTSGYLLVGPRFVQGTDQKKNGPRTDSAFTGVDLGLGLDQLLANRIRVGGEIGNGSAGEAALPFLSGFVMFGRR